MPSRYRDLLLASVGGQLTITRHPDGCLMIFTRPEWAKFFAEIAAMPMMAHRWKRIFMGNARDVDMDASGRVLVPPELRAVAGITREVKLLGMGNHFELWDKARCEAVEEADMQSEMPDAFKHYVYGMGGPA